MVIGMRRGALQRATALLLLGSLVGCVVQGNPGTQNERSWDDVQLSVATVSARDAFLNFFRSLTLFQFNAPQISEAFKYLEIEGNANSVIRDAATIHIRGDLNSDIYLDEPAELVVGGNVTPNANIFVNALSSIYVDGMFEGNLFANESYRLHVNGDHRGLITTTGSSTRISVHGNFEGEMKTAGEGLKSAIIIVDGFTLQQRIEEIYADDYVTLTGVFHSSDTEPGYYRRGRSNQVYYTVVQEQ